MLDAVGYEGFEIRQSSGGERTTAIVMPDIATCPDCLRELLDPANRRYRYPFTNCTNCGPRYSIIEGLPYDRPSTTMRGFAMCEACRAEYEDPRDRRFHAQPIACPRCGPHLELWAAGGEVLATAEEALGGAVEAIRRGQVVAAKGLGGFHLIVDARADDAVRLLRQRKAREEKPFALMYPSLAAIAEQCEVDDLEARLLASAESPIVLLKRRQDAGRATPIARSVAPGNPWLGVMLPYTPMHHLLMGELGFPVVATSGNLSDEPICTDEREALARLAGLADVFLVHDRPIARHVDDSIARIVVGRELVLRRARGYAPLPVRLKTATPPLLAVGAHLKNAVAVTAGENVFVSQHIGDLETPQAFDAFRAVIASLGALYRVTFASVACDAHPAYMSTVFANGLGLPVVAVQHHYAHVLGCMAENDIDAPVLGISWDGTGFGSDGTVWGGEFLDIDARGFQRFAHLRTFRLPGGEQAVKEPRRSAFGLLHAIFGAESSGSGGPIHEVSTFTTAEVRVLTTMLERGVNAPWTSSAGRLFDAVAAIAGLRQVVRFEGQAAMELEFAAAGQETDEVYPFRVAAATSAAGPLIVDWEPMIRAILEDVRGAVSPGLLSARFHNTLVEMMAAVACQAGRERVVLSGGCFQNKYLLERAVQRLRADGLRPYWPQRIPPNDGGIALGQVMAALRAVPGGRDNAEREER
jgi:hydrogenase maturation protein HypF